MYFKQHQTSLTEADYKAYLLELSAIVDGFPDFNTEHFIELSAVCAEFATKLEGDSEDMDSLRKILKLSSGSFIYIMQMTSSLLNCVQTVEELTGKDILGKDKNKLVVIKPTEH